MSQDSSGFRKKIINGALQYREIPIFTWTQRIAKIKWLLSYLHDCLLKKTIVFRFFCLCLSPLLLYHLHFWNVQHLITSLIYHYFLQCVFIKGLQTFRFTGKAKIYTERHLFPQPFIRGLSLARIIQGADTK